jgi:serine/threonine-protein kinase RsbW
LRGSEAVRSSGNDAGMFELVLDIPPDPEQVRTARLFAAAAARHFGLDEEGVEDLKVAISEACTNAIHAHRGAGIDDPIHIVATSEPQILRFDVVDAGGGFDPEIAKADADYTPPSGLAGGSLGLALIRSLFPKVEIMRNPDRGMTVSIVADRPAGDA